MFSRGSDLQKKRDGSYSNSTKSCRVSIDGRTGYSYAQKIFEVVRISKKDKREVVLFNWYKFSNTTTQHQYTLRDFVRNSVRLKGLEIIEIESHCMDASGLTLVDYLETVEFWRGLHRSRPSIARLEALEKFLLKKDKKSFLTAIERLKDDETIKEKSAKVRESRHRLETRLTHCQYANKKTFLRALKKFDGITHRINFTSAEKLESLVDDTTKGEILRVYGEKARPIIEKVELLKTLGNLGSE